MIPAQLYQSLYLIFVTILTFIVSNRYATYTNSRLYSLDTENPAAAFILTLCFALFIGFRPISGVFIDMMNHVILYDFYSRLNYSFTWDTENIIFDNLFKYIAHERYDIRIIFVGMAFLYFGGMFVAFKKMFPKDILYMLIIYLGAFSTFSFGTNGIKNGVGASLFLCALAYKDKRLIFVLLCLLTYGFHHAMILPIMALLVTYFYKNTKTYFYLWIACIILSAAHVTVFQSLFNSMADTQAEAYLGTVDGEASHGFRPDFIFYSSFPVISGYYAIFMHNYKSATYQRLFNTYLLINSIWMLCMYASFTNRIAYLSWLMLPVVLVYPFFDKAFVPNQYRKLNSVAWFHLGFTLAMQVIYYGLFK